MFKHGKAVQYSYQDPRDKKIDKEVMGTDDGGWHPVIYRSPDGTTSGTPTSGSKAYYLRHNPNNPSDIAILPVPKNGEVIQR